MSETRERVHLTTAAIGYAETVRHLELGQPEAAAEALRGAWDYLETTALVHAAALGQLDAGERAELLALRCFRDHVAALRGELAECGHVAETLDGIFALVYPDVVGDDRVPIAGHPGLFLQKGKR